MLESFEVRPAGKPPIVLKGNGTLVYDNMGNLKMDIRADEASSDVLRASGIDIRDGMISTDGRTAVDMQNKKLTYFIEGQPALGAPSGPLALNRPRYWEVDGDVLTLTTKDADGNPMSVAKWKKVP